MKSQIQFSKVVDGDPTQMKSPVQLPSKKVYEAPKLLKYGSLTEITAGHTVRGHRDSKTSTNKTG